MRKLHYFLGIIGIATLALITSCKNNNQNEEEKLKFDKELIIDNNSFTTEPEQKTFKIYVRVDSGFTEEVKYQVTLDAEQKEMK